MPYQEITGGDGTTGQTGEQVKDILNETHVELYAAVEEEFSRAFTETLVFDKPEIYYAPHVQDDEINFTLAGSGHLVNASSGAVMIINADGVNPINFGAGFDFIYGIDSGDILDAGTYEIYFLYTNGSVRVNVPGTTAQASGLSRLATPGSFNAQAGSTDTEMDLSWSDVDNEVEYQIEKSATGTGGWVLLANPAAGATTYTETGLDPGQTVYYRIKAIGDGVSFNDSLYATDSGMTTNTGDTDPPVVSLWAPLNGASDWAINRPITITMNEQIRKSDGTTLTDANVADVITLKQTNSGGSNIAFTATIDGSKTVITVTPSTHYGLNQLVYVAIHDIEDVDSNAIVSPISITFTSTDFTIFNGTTNRLQFGDVLDSVWAAANTVFRLKVTAKDLAPTGARVFMAKFSSADNQRSFQWYHSGNDVRFGYFMTIGNATIYRIIQWVGAVTSGEHDWQIDYDGSVSTGDGLGRVTLKKDGVTVSAGKSMHSSAGALGHIYNSTAQLSVGGMVNSAGVVDPGAMFVGEMKDVLVESGVSTVNINVPVVKTGTDVSGNVTHGTWV